VHRIYIKTFGCKVNYAESMAAAELLRAEGLDACELTGARLPGRSQDAGPPAVLVNSCCVTTEAERKALQFVRRLRREHPDVEVLFTGCSARHPDIRQRYADAGAQVFDYYPAAVDWLKARAGGNLAQPDLHPATKRSRAFIKIQDGCTCRCSFCIIPDVRPYASRPPAEILGEVNRCIAAGFYEVVLTGVNSGHYGRAPFRSEGTAQTESEPGPDLAGYQLCELLDDVLAVLPEGYRLRLSSIEPEDVSDRLLAQLAHPRMCPHLHMPLQSGSDAVLKAMRRRYTAAQYLDIVARFRRACPEGAVTTDILVGYPTESQGDFDATLKLCTAAGFERIHGFPYSPRPGTPAAQLPPLPRTEVRHRNRQLIDHCAQIEDRRWQRFVGGECTVIVEEQADGLLRGHGEAYQIVHLPGEPDAAELIGRCLPVRLASYGGGIFTGELRR